jgi:hypothetical protein
LRAAREAASRERYEWLVAEWVAQGRRRPWSGFCRAGKLANGCDLVVVELVQRCLKFADDYYRKDGRPTSELLAVGAAVRHIQRLHSRLPRARKALQFVIPSLGRAASPRL